jgi:polyhydroxybutyrate depolymerase
MLSVACGLGAPTRQIPPPDPEQLLKDRPYELLEPDGTEPAPLIVALHGQGGGGREIADDLELTPLVKARRFYLAMPDGTANQAGYQWWNATTDGLPPYDRVYLKALIEDALKKHAIDPKRVYVVGFSIGAFMAHRLACDDSPEIAAIMSLSGAATRDPEQCPTTSPVSAVEIHGDHDDVIDYYGGPMIGGAQSGPSARDTVRLWAGNDHCTGLLTDVERLDLTPDLAGSETKRQAYTGCPAGVDVELWTVVGGGHWQTLQPDFGGRLVDWLYAHPKP